MKNKKGLFLSVLILLAALATVTGISCNKVFDAPPVFVPPVITPNMSIAELQALHVTTGGIDDITTDGVIGGIVIANDSSGNFYQQFIIQDATAGIIVKLDALSSYTSFPMGREVFINVKGLALGEYGGLIELGVDNNGSLGNISTQLQDKYIVKGSFNNVVTPKVVSISALTDADQSTLIELDNFEVKDADTNKIYADPIGKNSANITLKNCSSDTITMRSSGYAYFAGLNVPNGNGTVTGVYSFYKTYKTTKQINIRDTSDLKLYGARCGGGGGGGNGDLVSIDSIRNLYNGTGIKLGAYKIAGTVISDAASKNVSGGVAILQDGSNSGISIYFGGTVTYNIGDSIVLDVTGDSLLNYKGSLEIKTAYGATKPAPVASGRVVVPQQMTISQILAGMPDIEYTLVKIVNATATNSSGTYAGSSTLTDATGSMTMFTNTGSTTATFAGDALPAGPHTWTGYCNFYNTTVEFHIRNTSDVQ
ncbi:MAG: DUF5689 domain-containing protein [Ginsengibacter sp.]